MAKVETNKPQSARSLATSLAIAFFSLSFIILLIAEGIRVYQLVLVQQDTLSVRQQNIAQEASQKVAASIQEKFSVLETAIQFTDPFTTSSDTRKNIMRSYLAADETFRQLALLDKNGNVTALASRSSETLSQQFSLALKNNIQDTTSTGQNYIGPVYIDDKTSEPLVTIAIPVKTIFGDFQGTLVAEVNLKFMWDLVDQLKVGNTGYAYIVDNQGNLIAFRDPTLVLRGENLKQISEVAEFIGNPSVSTDATPEIASYKGLLGDNVVGTYIPLGVPQWAVMIELPTSEAYQEMWNQSAIALLVTLILTALAAGVGVYLARYLAAPLIGLSQVATEVAGGNLAIQAELKGPAEVVNLASAFNTMTSRLRDLIGSLENRIAERTHNLELAAEVGRTVSQVHTLDVMLTNAAELIREQFNLYYVQVYLINPSKTYLNLQAGTGEVGKQLLEVNHRLPLNKNSINGRAAVEKESIVISNTTESPTFKSNPLLPNTRSEMAVPLMIGEKVVGVLDMQSEHEGSLSEETLPAFKALAGQLAIAVQNSTYLEEVEKARAEAELQARRLVHDNWTDYLDAVHKPENIGYVFQADRVTQMADETAITDKSLVMPITVTGELLGSLAVELEGQSLIARSEELVSTVARQVAQHVENLRLLDSADRYRAEAEQATRRLTHESWQEYMEGRDKKDLGYIYDLKEVRALDQDEDKQIEGDALSLPLKVRDEAVGKIVVNGANEEDVNLVNAVAERLSQHIEGLRLSLRTEQALAATRKQAQREQALRQITSAVRSSTDAATILRSAARELGNILGRQTIVHLVPQEEKASQNEDLPAEASGEAVANNGAKPVSPADQS